jgi:hypothetical protein
MVAEDILEESSRYCGMREERQGDDLMTSRQLWLETFSLHLDMVLALALPIELGSMGR